MVDYIFSASNAGNKEYSYGMSECLLKNNYIVFELK